MCDSEVHLPSEFSRWPWLLLFLTFMCAAAAEPLLGESETTFGLFK